MGLKNVICQISCFGALGLLTVRSENDLNSVHTRCIVKTGGFTRGRL